MQLNRYGHSEVAYGQLYEQTESLGRSVCLWQWNWNTERRSSGEVSVVENYNNLIRSHHHSSVRNLTDKLSDKTTIDARKSIFSKY